MAYGNLQLYSGLDVGIERVTPGVGWRRIDRGGRGEGDTRRRANTEEVGLEAVDEAKNGMVDARAEETRGEGEVVNITV